MSALTSAIECLKDAEWDRDKKGVLVYGYSNAIRILEAAEGFTADEKERLRQAFEFYITEYAALPGMHCPGRALKEKVFRLIESLPEE